jgi:phosphoribosylamine--glycine ligase
MRVLVVGGGAREHALTWKLAQSPQVTELFAAPGNAGMAEIASCVPIDPSGIVELADFAQSLHVDLTVIGPELPLALGAVDELQKRGLAVFGPSRAAAELEASKVFSKRFMEANGIPTAPYWVAQSRERGEQVLDSGETGWPAVIKADGLAAGKGVIIARDRDEAQDALVRMFDQKEFGSAAKQVLIETCLQGVEVSFHVVTDGSHVVPLASAQDYKRARDGNEGPNTGGMGTVSPSPRLTKDLQSRILKEVVKPTILGMQAAGRVYRGVLYVGIMVTPAGPMVLEYNCRLGDPETQVILTRLDGDLLGFLLAAVAGRLHEVHPRWAHHASTCVVVASGGYPGKPETGKVIEGLDAAAAVEGVTVFHAGTRKDGDVVRTSGGRVLGITGTSPSVATARERAYRAVGHVRFEGMQYRTDIGADVVEYLHPTH